MIEIDLATLFSETAKLSELPGYEAAAVDWRAKETQWF
jgi:hypothetical protein